MAAFGSSESSVEAIRPKWVSSLAAMVVSWDIVKQALTYRGAYSRGSPIYDTLSKNGMAFETIMINFPIDELIRKILDDGPISKEDDVYSRVMYACIGPDAIGRPALAWKDAIRRGDEILQEIDKAPLDAVSFDQWKLPMLLDIDGCIGFFDVIAPLVRGFYLYSVGETLVNYGEAELINRWYEIVKAKGPLYMTNMIIQEPNLLDIQINIPQVLIGIIISYGKWELRPRSEVMTWLLHI
ncbi:MAG: hypothetical protein Harvfovirus60_6 [Harvfovirus sp.]|uniref:Uncharacterized protein n=1 Tax=Harvfovirus sp. TaxID=2487768 RepID=A0A3G5A7F4_9VIRU|nr:MAG: hypothetical protein Harvfovirus60_6 [Harvfovirus sp.]